VPIGRCETPGCVKKTWYSAQRSPAFEWDEGQILGVSRFLAAFFDLWTGQFHNMSLS
jgi:hypothetical protein